MVYLVKKRIKGQTYLFLEERAYINGKSRRVWQKYLGNEKKIKEMGITFSPKNVKYKTMKFGGSAALWQVAQKIGLVEIIDQLAGKQREQNLSLGEYMVINIINRCVSPASKSQLGTWFSRDYLSTIFPIKSEKLNAQTYWNHFQLLDEEKIIQIERELTKRVLQAYKLNLSCLLFDPTNFFTFINKHENSQLPQFGHSKESRNNLRIINVSLLCTLHEGIPLFHKTYEGNVQDAKHFKKIISEITSHFKAVGQQIEEIVLLFDKGNHSPEAFQAIDHLHLPFIASLRNSTQKDLLNVPESAFSMVQLSSNNKTVGYYCIQREIYGKARTLYVLLDPRKKKRATILFEEKLQKGLTSITSFQKKLNIKKWRSKEAVEKKLKSLVGKKPFPELLSCKVTGTFGKLEVSVHVDELAKAAYLATLGRSIIFTSLVDWPPEKVIQAFRDKYVVEDAFKQLKNHKFLSIRPMYHWSDTCIRAHVFSCIMGLLLLSLVRLELRRKSLSLSYDQILDSFSELSLTQIYTKSNSTPFYKLNERSTLSDKIYRILKLKRFLPK